MKMKDKQMNLKDWIGAYFRGDFNSKNVQTQINAGWFDWFCDDHQLYAKTIILAGYLLQIVSSPKIDKENHYVFFKNNCPLYGDLYDDFRICDIKTGEVFYTVITSSGYDSNKGESAVWGRENDFKEPIVSGTWFDVLKFFST